MTSEQNELLAIYFASRRWFAGKGRDFSVSHVHPLPWLSATEPRVRIEIVTVRFGDGTQDTYQFPIAYLPLLDPAMGHALVGQFEHPELGHVAAYDAVYFASALKLLLDGFRTARHGDQLRFELAEGAVLPTHAVIGKVMTAEQSNTSIAYGEQAILKLFRRISDGGNPDIEVHEALTRNGGEHVAALLGWIEGRWSDSTGEAHHGHLGILQVFLGGATDGWAIALSSVGNHLAEDDPYPHGADFAGAAEQLGQATAEVHAALARLFATATLDGGQQDALVAAMELRLDEAVAIVPALEEYDAALRARFAELAEFSSPITVQRIHGDLHLGQTLRTVDGWKIIDFEGEPAKSLTERVALDSPMRDVAGMLRSFDYAAGAALREFDTSDDLDHLRYRADQWSRRNRHAFLRGYANGGGIDVDDYAVLLRAYEADKAVYEAVYEARNRPTWLVIPLQAIARLVASE